jgi:hypothetical protein
MNMAVSAMNLTNKSKHWVLRHYLAIAICLLALSLVTLLTFGRSWENAVRLTVLGLPFTFVFFVQKQTLEETQLFKELFRDFNSRYDVINEDLNRIRTDNTSPTLSPKDRDTLYKYFNLCGEEFLYYKLGFISEEVWCSWKRGMESFLRCPRIWMEWAQDPGGDSYYGLTFPSPPAQSICPCCGEARLGAQEAA